MASNDKSGSVFARILGVAAGVAVAVFVLRAICNREETWITEEDLPNLPDRPEEWG